MYPQKIKVKAHKRTILNHAGVPYFLEIPESTFVRLSEYTFCFGVEIENYIFPLNLHYRPIVDCGVWLDNITKQSTIEEILDCFFQSKFAFSGDNSQHIDEVKIDIGHGVYDILNNKFINCVYIDEDVINCIKCSNINYDKMRLLNLLCQHYVDVECKINFISELLDELANDPKLTVHIIYCFTNSHRYYHTLILSKIKSKELISNIYNCYKEFNNSQEYKDLFEKFLGEKLEQPIELKQFENDLNPRYYYLDDNDNPVKCGIDRYIQWNNNDWDRRIIKQDRIELEDKIFISTVFLGINHNFRNDGPPLIFETMIFVNCDSIFCSRTATKEEALEQHKYALENYLELIKDS